MPLIVQRLRDSALAGDTAAASLLLRHGLPLSSSETRIEGAADLADLDPTDRLRHISRRAADGSLPLEHATFLADLARKEIEAQTVQPVRQLLLDLRKGIAVHTAVERLIALASTIDLHTECTLETQVIESQAVPTENSSDD